MNDLFSYYSVLDKMWEGCRCVKEVVKLEVFWNIVKKNVYEFDVCIDFKEDLDDIYLGIVVFFEESNVEIDDLIDKSLYVGCKLLRYMIIII